MVKTQLDREWNLFVDWCESMQLEAIPASMESISAFLQEFPAPLSTQTRRIKAIRRAHNEATVPFYIARPDTLKVIRDGEKWANLSQAITQTPKLRYPIGLRGRRDAFLLVLIGTLEMTRKEAQSVQESDIVLFPELMIQGRPVLVSEPARSCPKCAITRWLRIVNLAAFGAKSDMRVLLDPMTSLETHDCYTGLTGEWRYAPILLPGIDKYGWINNTYPISLRSISAIVARCQGSPESEEKQFIRPEATGRFKDATSNELAYAYDDVDERLTELLLKTNKILGESNNLLEDINELL